ncbi:peptidylprolyl isomerase [Andreprevotia chitinilytica]|uniref:peptidylprolyl isomerase n=1 Tax=Andreprevotia chitinilytica TaxID=396808 RepID=UPI0005522265|nr:peptidylprolyl isomerase [Andreprevotia chitinilytica]
MTITVNGVEITDAAITAAEPQFGQTADPRAAATETLILRQVLLQTAEAQGVEGADEDQRIDNLLQSSVEAPEVTEAECRAFYEANPQSFVRGEEAEASHILFSSDPSVPAGLLRAKAEGILNELKAEPFKFTAYAKEHSGCPSGKQGGDLGSFGRGQMVPEFDAAVFNSPENALYPELVETQFGLHIIKVGKKQGGSAVAFEEVQERLAQYLGEMGMRRAMNEYLQKVVATAKIDGYTMSAH